MSKTELVEVTLKLPKPIYTFYKKLADSQKTQVENKIADDLLNTISNFYLDIETEIKDLIIHQYGLEGMVKTE
ncbi:unnamed protein product [marine sediment metagenome]|uniref:Uncharacterized protein n=1 Tax=marine sediment metagenome TaxID=412755 RepID=X1M550_9ZZZZ